MEPKFSSPELNAQNQERSPESLPNVPTPESTPEAPLQNPERGESQPERMGEQSAAAQASLSAQAAQPVTLPTPIAPVDDTAQATTSDDMPAVAADEDLIEKEWVDKAKRIISDTRDDPARREREVGRLQADYLKKRYGKQLGVEPE